MSSAGATLAYWLFVVGLRRLTAATAATLSLAEPLVATALGIGILRERLSLPIAAGTLLLLAGLVLVSVPRAAGARLWAAVKAAILILERWMRACAPLPRQCSRLPHGILCPPPSVRYGTSSATIMSMPRSSSARPGTWRPWWNAMTSRLPRLPALRPRRWAGSQAVRYRPGPAWPRCTGP